MGGAKVSSRSTNLRRQQAARRALGPLAGLFALQVVLAAVVGSLCCAREKPAACEGALEAKAPGGGTVPGPSPELRERALRAARNARAAGHGPKPLLTIIDYSLPSSERRLWVIDLETREVRFHEFVAHGRGSGMRRATRFSNDSGTLASSLGIFETGETYDGQHGRSLRLDGLEPGINDRARERAIVIHGAWYVSEEHVREHGRLGRSWGCPAVDLAVVKPLIETIADGSLLFAYFPNPDWLESSRFLRTAGRRPEVTVEEEGRK